MEAYPQKIRELVLGAYEDGDETADHSKGKGWSIQLPPGVIQR